MCEGLRGAQMHALPTWAVAGRGWAVSGSCFSGRRMKPLRSYPEHRREVSRVPTPDTWPSSLVPPKWSLCS